MKKTLFATTLALASALDMEELRNVAPKLHELHVRAQEDPATLAKELSSAPFAQIMPVLEVPKEVSFALRADATPTVFTHGMGDSCFNSGMKQITAAAGTHRNSYSVCIPGGDNDISDTISGFLVNMDKNVDNFAERVRKDPKLASGFNAVGLSQGNSVVRGYIQRYNDPPVKNVVHVHGTVMGVSGFPNCNPVGALPKICDTISELLGDLAYAKIVQEALFQSNYFRDPLRENATAYLTNSQIAQWNNENPVAKNQTYNTNFNAVNNYLMIKAMKDTMVFPNAGEWWGEFAPGQFKNVLDMKSSPLYANFGLKEADAAGKIKFGSTAGEHLQFTMEQLYGWMDATFN